MFKKIFLLVLSLASFNIFSLGKRSANFDREEKKVETKTSKQDLQRYFGLAIEKDDVDFLNKLTTEHSEFFVNNMDQFLYKSVMSGSEKTFLYLINNFNFDKDLLSNLINYAIKNNNKIFIKRLVLVGAYINYVDSDGYTPLFNYLDSSSVIDLELLKFLLELGADPNSKPSGVSLVQVAIEMDCQDLSVKFKIIKLLLEYGLDVNTVFLVDDYASNLLIYCSSSDENLDIVKFLVEKGVDIGLMDQEGHDALYYAITTGSSEIVKFLLSCGAKFFKKDFNYKAIETYFEWKDLLPEKINLKHLYLNKKSEESVKKWAMNEIDKFMKGSTIDDLVYLINNGTRESLKINLQTLDHLYYYRNHFLDKKFFNYVVPDSDL